MEKSKTQQVTTQMEQEIDLVKRARENDREAFGLLVDQYANSVYAIAYGYVFNTSDSRDLVQEIFIKAFRSLADLRSAEQFRRWLFRLANRKCLDWLDKKQVTSYADPTEIDRFPQAEALDTTETDRQQVADVLARLPEEHRLVLSLRYLENLDYAQIADALDIDTDDVSNRLLRAKRYVKKHLSHLSDGR